ncbi:17154_t:CDS:2, partial [Dentiscutata erythropus]
YLEDVQDQDIRQKLQETVGVVTQFQQDNSAEMMNDLHLFNKFRPLYAFTTEIKQRMHRKVRYANGFGKIKKALNLVLDLNCEDEFIDMVNSFINHKKTTEKTSHHSSGNSAINPLDPNLYVRNNTNDESEIGLYSSDSIVQKKRGRLPKSVSEEKLIQSSSENSILNLPDSELNVSNACTQLMQISQQQYALRNTVRTLNNDNIYVKENISISRDPVISPAVIVSKIHGNWYLASKLEKGSHNTMMHSIYKDAKLDFKDYCITNHSMQSTGIHNLVELGITLDEQMIFS